MININENLDSAVSINNFLATKYKRYLTNKTEDPSSNSVISSYRVPVVVDKMRVNVYFPYYTLSTQQTPKLEIGAIDHRRYLLSNTDQNRLLDVIKRIATKWKMELRSTVEYSSIELKASPASARQIVLIIDDYIKEINALVSKGGRRV